MKPVLRFLCFACLLLVASAVDPRKRVLISDILEVVDARGNLERLRLENVEWVRKSLKSKSGEASRTEFAERVFDRALEKYIEQSKDTFSWSRKEEVYVAQYDKFYTEAQLKALLAFLRTNAGQAMSRGQMERVSVMQQKLATAVQGDLDQSNGVNDAVAKSDANAPAGTEAQLYTEAQRKALIAFLQTDAGQAMQRAETEILNGMAQDLEAASHKERGGPDIMNDAIAEVQAEMRVENEKLFTMSPAEVEEKARNGNPVAQYLAGSMYADGHGV